MKAILMSIKPEWCELIFSGIKISLERKTAPKLKPPFKVYVYQTKNRRGNKVVNEALDAVYGGGKVVGEFVCDTVEHVWRSRVSNGIVTRIKQKEILCIDDPKRYDTPKELSEFWKVRCINKTGNCGTCEVKPACINYITRAPQSFMYVEEIEE